MQGCTIKLTLLTLLHFYRLTSERMPRRVSFFGCSDGEFMGSESPIRFGFDESANRTSPFGFSRNLNLRFKITRLDHHGMMRESRLIG